MKQKKKQKQKQKQNKTKKQRNKYDNFDCSCFLEEDIVSPRNALTHPTPKLPKVEDMYFFEVIGLAC